MIEATVTFNSDTRVKLKPSDARSAAILKLAFTDGIITHVVPNSDGSVDLTLTTEQKMPIVGIPRQPSMDDPR